MLYYRFFPENIIGDHLFPVQLLSKSQDFCSSKNIINIVKRLAIACAKLLLIHKPNKRFIFRIYKEFLQRIKKKTIQFKKK